MRVFIGKMSTGNNLYHVKGNMRKRRAKKLQKWMDSFDKKMLREILADLN